MTRAAGAGPLVIQNGGGDPFESIEKRLAGTREVQPHETRPLKRDAVGQTDPRSIA